MPTLPTNLSTSTARPDLVIVSENNVTMIELTIPSDSRAAMIKAKERKNNKPNYNSLIGDLENHEFSVNYRTLEIGLLGHYLSDAVFCISRSFQLTKSLLVGTQTSYYRITRTPFIFCNSCNHYCLPCPHSGAIL